MPDLHQPTTATGPGGHLPMKLILPFARMMKLAHELDLEVTVFDASGEGLRLRAERVPAKHILQHMGLSPQEVCTFYIADHPGAYPVGSIEFLWPNEYEALVSWTAIQSTIHQLKHEWNKQITAQLAAAESIREVTF